MLNYDRFFLNFMTLYKNLNMTEHAALAVTNEDYVVEYARRKEALNLVLDYAHLHIKAVP